MIHKRIYFFALLVGISCATASQVLGQQQQAEIKYISKEAVYIDAGKNQGLAVGDTLRLYRANKLIAFILVKSAASSSAACTVLRAAEKPQIGDVVKLPSKAVTARPAPTPGQRQKAREAQRRTQTASSNTNRIRGYLSAQSYWQQDGSGTTFSSVQPSLSGRLKIQNIAGSGIEFRMRQRSRLYERTASQLYPDGESEWQHRIFEMSLVYSASDVPWEFGAGRVYSPHIRGIGLIDGVHIARQIDQNVRIGFAAGKDPDPQTAAFDANRSKFGAFVAFESGSYDRQKLATTIAYAGSHDGGMINREFIYLQNNYWRSRRFSIYQSIEIDLNRDWRKQAAGKSVTFSNFYLTAHMTINNSVSANLSVDARKNPYTLSTINTPDSLFDDATRKGVSGGVSVTPAQNMRTGANVSLRFPENGLHPIISSNFYYQIRQFPLRGHAIAFRLSFLRTEFTNAYRPMLDYRLPLQRRLNVSFNTGAYLYDTPGMMTSSYYFGLRADYSFFRHYFLAASYRQYLDKRNQSKQIFVDLGLNF